MDPAHLILLFLAIGLIAFLYSSVGHAGASGYIATMTLFGIAPTVIRPTALVLNILVASIGAFQFWRAGHFSWKLFWPFALLSIPAAYVGGYLQPSASVLRILIGIVLLFSATRLVFRRSDPPQTFPPPRPMAISVGAGLGFLAGLTGTGGGIFLTPLLDSRSRCNHWRRCRIEFREQAFCRQSDFAVSGYGPPYRGNEADFHKVGRLTSIARAVRVNRPYLTFSFSFGAVSGDQELVL